MVMHTMKNETSHDLGQRHMAYACLLVTFVDIFESSLANGRHKHTRKPFNFVN